MKSKIKNQLLRGGPNKRVINNAFVSTIVDNSIKTAFCHCRIDEEVGAVINFRL